MKKFLFVFCLILSVLCIEVGILKAEIEINNEDVEGVFGLVDNCVPHIGLNEARTAGDWGSDKWGNHSPLKWSPLYAGITNHGSDSVTIRMVFSKANIDFYKNAKFKGTDTRIPFALEIDVVDPKGVFGEEDYNDFYISSNNLPTEVKLISDTSIFDSANQMSVIIARPDKLESNKVYEIELTPTQKKNVSGSIHLVFQLSVNYKYLAAIKNGESTKCDILTLINQVQGENNIDEIMSWFQGNHGDELPEKAIDPWYYFIAAKSDIYRSISTSGTNSICSDNFQNPAHDQSGFGYCNNLFDVKVGSDYGNFIKFKGDAKVYYVFKGQLWWVKDEDTFYAMGGDFKNVIEYPTLQLIDGVAVNIYRQIIDNYPISGTIVDKGLIVKVPDSITPEKVYQFFDGQWHWFESWYVFNTLYGYDDNDIVDIPLNVFKMYQEGNSIGSTTDKKPSQFLGDSHKEEFELIPLPDDSTDPDNTGNNDNTESEPKNQDNPVDTPPIVDTSSPEVEDNNSNVGEGAKDESNINDPNGEQDNNAGDDNTDINNPPIVNNPEIKPQPNLEPNRNVNPQPEPQPQPKPALRKWYEDQDADGYSNGMSQDSVNRPVSYYYLATELTAVTLDCNDRAPSIYPGAEEICGDGIDQDCNGDDLSCPTKEDDNLPPRDPPSEDTPDLHIEPPRDSEPPKVIEPKPQEPEIPVAPKIKTYVSPIGKKLRVWAEIISSTSIKNITLYYQLSSVISKSQAKTADNNSPIEVASNWQEMIMSRVPVQAKNKQPKEQWEAIISVGQVKKNNHVNILYYIEIVDKNDKVTQSEISKGSNHVPTMTEWGIIISMALIVWWRKKQVSLCSAC